MLTYILGILCFLAIIISVIMLICSINMRRLNVKFWGVFLCCSLVCSFTFYGLHKSVFGKKTDPVIDFSGITPEITEEDILGKPAEEPAPVEPEPVTEPEETDAPENEDLQPADEPEQAEDTETTEKPETKPVPEEPTREPENQEYAEDEPQPEQPEEAVPEEEVPVSPPAPPEIEYEGPFRTE